MLNTLRVKTHQIGTLYLLLAAAVFLFSCKKDLYVPPPPDLLVSDQIFTSDSKATAVITSIYGSMINGSVGFSNELATIYAGYSADELLMFNAFETQQEFFLNTLTSPNTGIKTLWSSLYKHIYFANAALQGMAEATTISAEIKEELMAECRFIRAFCYFYLVNLWGDVPLIQSTSYHKNAFAHRTPSPEVWESIIADLQAAKLALAQPSASNKSRPSKMAAAALLARVYLYRQQWEKAEAEATEVISSGLYSPIGAPSVVFLANSKESIWQLVPTQGYLKETSEMRPLVGAPQNYLTPQIVSIFEPGDRRRQAWIDSVVYQGTKYYYPAKYRNTTSAVTEHYTILRIAEQYLIRAEARLKQMKKEEAVNDLNIIRQRAGLAPLQNTSTEAELTLALECENYREFFVEWGHRWLDLKRWNKVLTVLQPLKPAITKESLLYPIPQDEMLSNPSLTQNPGY